MTGVIGALVAFAVVLAIVLVLAVRPAVRRLAHTAATVRGDLTARLDRLAAVRRARPSRATAAGEEAAPSPVAASPSLIGGRGRHRRVDGAS